MFHRTERLFLRPAWPEDWEAVLGGIADEGVVRNLARAPWPYSADDAHWWVGQQQDPCTPAFVIVDADSGELVGSAGLGRKEDDGEVELGYWIKRDRWGQGYATEAGRGVVEVARLLGHKRLAAGHFVDNPASGKVLRKIGFRPTGQTGNRFSRARGKTVPSVEFVLDLDEDSAPLMQAA